MIFQRTRAINGRSKIFVASTAASSPSPTPSIAPFPSSMILHRSPSKSDQPSPSSPTENNTLTKFSAPKKAIPSEEKSHIAPPSATHFSALTSATTSTSSSAIEPSHITSKRFHNYTSNATATPHRASAWSLQRYRNCTFPPHFPIVATEFSNPSWESFAQSI